MQRARIPARPGVALVAVLLAAVGLGACSSPSSTKPSSPPSSTAAASRPSSPAKLSILAPRNGQLVHGNPVELKLALSGARIVATTTTAIRPDQGHVHVQVDGKIISMTYGLQQRLPTLPPGPHVVRVEFVAADHLPFDPRILAQAAFEVR